MLGTKQAWGFKTQKSNQNENHGRKSFWVLVSTPGWVLYKNLVLEKKGLSENYDKKIVQSKGPNKNDDQKNCPVKGAEWKWWSNRRSVHLLRSFAISSAKCGWWGEDSIYLLNSTTRGGGMMRRIRRMIIVWEVGDKILISEGKTSRSGRWINLYSQLVLISISNWQNLDI